MRQELPTLSGILFFSLWALIANVIAKSKHFFHLTPTTTPLLPIRGRQLLSVFAIYLLFSMVIPIFLIRVLSAFTAEQTILSFIAADWIELLLTVALFVSLMIYLRWSNPTLLKKIWKDTSLPNHSKIPKDFFIGAMTWLLGFPLIAVVSQLCDLVVAYFFGVQNYEQVAVRLLKRALETPSVLPVVLVLILVMAPAIEEFLFRGCLQRWLKSRIGTKAAILLTALIFALFHFSFSQGLGNISLVLSLFVFSCYLGFIYEKQASLFASIGLHFTFNATSVLFILLQVDL